MYNLIIIIPSHNELNNLKKFINILNKKYNILVLDDCSTDGSLDFLKKNSIPHITNKKNLGYEKNIIKGINYLRSKKTCAKYIATLDADGEHPINKISQIYNFAIKKNCDLVICNRNIQNRSIEKIISKLFYLFFNLKDPLSGMKFYKSKKLFSSIYYTSSKYFLVDLVTTFYYKKKNIRNFEIKVKKNLNSQIGSGIKIQKKLFKILLHIIKIKIFQSFSNNRKCMF